jgi:hypothetical protein
MRLIRTTTKFNYTNDNLSLFSRNNFPIDPPQVTLSLGSTLNPDDIKEGDDVYFECHIKANPKEHRITWSHDVSVLYRWI